MSENVSLFLQEGTNEYNDACALWDLYTDTKNMLLNEIFGVDDSAKSDTTTTKDEVCICSAL